jgi:hypothetical protein
MKEVKLVLSVVAMVEGSDDAKVVYQTEKLFGGAKVNATAEAGLVAEVIGAASDGVGMKPDSVKAFKPKPTPEPQPEAPAPAPEPEKTDEGGDEGGDKTEEDAESETTAPAPKKASRGRGKKTAAKKTASKTRKGGKKKSGRGK